MLFYRQERNIEDKGRCKGEIMKYFKVEQLENKNQFICYNGEETIFQSYSSVVAIIKDGVLTLGRDWDYSKTTLKHLYIFLENYVYCRPYEEKVKYSSNKRQAIQKLIDEGVIKYDEEMR